MILKEDPHLYNIALLYTFMVRFRSGVELLTIDFEHFFIIVQSGFYSIYGLFAQLISTGPLLEILFEGRPLWLLLMFLHDDGC